MNGPKWHLSLNQVFIANKPVLIYLGLNFIWNELEFKSLEIFIGKIQLKASKTENHDPIKLHE